MYAISLRFTEFKNLLLNFCMISLCHLCLDLKKESSFNIDLIVSAIRTSSNPQTHHKALLVLSTASKIFPVLFLFSVLFTLYLRFFTYRVFFFSIWPACLRTLPFNTSNSHVWLASFRRISYTKSCLCSPLWEPMWCAMTTSTVSMSSIVFWRPWFLP